MKNRMMLILIAGLILLLAACTGTASEEPAASGGEETAVMPETTDDAMTESDEEMMAEDDEAMTESDEEMIAEHDEAMTESDEEMMAGDFPAWQQIALTNAQTGEQFTFADFAGKTIYVEPMATWCTNCRRQLTNVAAATSQFNADEVVFVALSVEVGLQDSQLASYADGQGFPFEFAVVNEELLRELVNEFGQSIANPPATPHFVIRADGTTTDLTTGIESTDEIIAFIQSEIQ